MNNVEQILISLIHEDVFQHVGKELRMECPFCFNEKKKFYVDSHKGSFICFSCSVHGVSLEDLVSQYLGITKVQAKEYLSERAYEDFDENLSELDDDDDFYTKMSTLFLLGSDPQLESDKQMIPLPTNYKSLIENFNNPEAYPFFNYLNGRGVTLEQIKKHKIGYVLRGNFTGANGQKNTITSSIIFLTCDSKGNPIYWNTRNIYFGTHSKIPKTINASASSSDEYSRNDVVFNLNNLKQGQDLYLSEGVFNALVVDDDKYCGVATFGKNVTPEQISLIASQQNKFNKLIIALDNDVEQSFIDRLVSKFEIGGVTQDRIKICYNKYIGKDFNDLGYVKSRELLDNSSSLNFSMSLNKILS